MEAKLARRSGGRSRKSVRQTKKTIDQLDWSIPYNTDNFIEPLDADGIDGVGSSLKEGVSTTSSSTIAAALAVIVPESTSSSLFLSSS